MKKLVVGLGEVLWDILPQRTQLGGAPANFAYMTRLFGDDGIVASRVGADERGCEVRRRMQDLGLPLTYVQSDNEHPTGVVKVELDEKGHPRFEIAAGAAWDYIEWTPELQCLAGKADAVCFGSLAQRSPVSHQTIRRFVAAARPETLKVFDVNMRQSYFSYEVLSESMKLANIVKLNDEELPKFMSLSNLGHVDELSSAKRLISLYDLDLVCLTRGCRGSLLVTRTESHEHRGFKIQVADTVGAGDAFTAGLVHEYLRGAPLEGMNETANLAGAWVASQVGATPMPKGEGLADILKKIGR